MTQKTELIYTKRPSIAASYLRALFRRRKGLKPGESLPDISAAWDQVALDPALLKRYHEACELPEDGYMPILYPHVIASPVYMSILTHKNFPFPLIGALHLRNHIIEHRRVKADEVFDLKVQLTEKRIVKQGIEFDFTIVLKVSEEKVWESVTTWLKQGKFGKEYDDSPNAALLKTDPEARHFKDLEIPRGIGKKYAKITGDYNPIHMSKLLAPLFGLKRDVAHAMWACANAMAYLPALPEGKPVRVDFAFKGPLFLDNKSHIRVREREGGIRFDYYCGDNDRPGINGDISTVDPGTQLT